MTRIPKMKMQESLKVKQQMDAAAEGYEEKFKTEVEGLNKKLRSAKRRLEDARAILDPDEAHAAFVEYETFLNRKLNLAGILRAPTEKLSSELTTINAPYCLSMMEDLFKQVTLLRRERQMEIVEKSTQQEIPYFSTKNNFREIEKVTKDLLSARNEIHDMMSKTDLATINKFYLKVVSSIPDSFPVDEKPVEYVRSKFYEIQEDIRKSQEPPGAFVISQTAIDAQEKIHHEVWLEKQRQTGEDLFRY